jgi:hypothetical protein
MSKLTEKLNELNKKLEAKNKQLAEKNKKNIDPTKTAWGIVVFLILIGLIVLESSILSSFLLALSALIVSPPVRKFLSNQVSFFSKSFVYNSIVASIVLVSFIVGSASINSNMREEWTKNKSSILETAKNSLEKGDLYATRKIVDKFSIAVKSDSDLQKLISDLNSAEKAKAAEELAQQKAEQQANQSTSSANEMSRVVSKVGSVIYLANQKTFIIERPTMLHIDGQIYPKGSGSPDYIQIGYRCRFTGTEYNVAEVFCER